MADVAETQAKTEVFITSRVNFWKVCHIILLFSKRRKKAKIYGYSIRNFAIGATADSSTLERATGIVITTNVFCRERTEESYSVSTLFTQAFRWNCTRRKRRR